MSRGGEEVFNKYGHEREISIVSSKSFFDNSQLNDYGIKIELRPPAKLSEGRVYAPVRIPVWLAALDDFRNWLIRETA
jgi:hypothetical protein